VDGADVVFEVAIDEFGEIAATTTFEDHAARPRAVGGSGRELHLPEIAVFFDEGDAVGVQSALLADFADDTDFGFAAEAASAEDELLFGDEALARDDAGAVLADDDGVGFFGEDAAFAVGADEEDGNLGGEAAAAALALGAVGEFGVLGGAGFVGGVVSLGVACRGFGGLHGTKLRLPGGVAGEGLAVGHELGLLGKGPSLFLG
jgi:hypothetical protein